MARAIPIRNLLDRVLRGPAGPGSELRDLPSVLALMNQRMLYRSKDDLIVDSLRARPPARRPRL